MAQSGPKTWEIGEFVIYKGEICVLTNVENTILGCKHYTVQNFDSGKQYTVYKHQLSEPNIQELQLGDIPDTEWEVSLKDDCEKVISIGNNEEEQEKRNIRHAILSDSEIDNVARARLSIHTENQTRWAVRLFRGKYISQKQVKFIKNRQIVCLF
jgi:hypothetical protein